MPTPIIQFVDVFKSYQSGSQPVTALEAVDLSLDAGDFVTIMGPSGGGKTTLLNLLAGLDLPDKGQIILNGCKISEFSDHELTLLRRKEIGFVFQFFIKLLQKSKVIMIFSQLFDINSSTYTYIISSGKGREALIIDPVIENTNQYIKILKDMNLKLVKVIDTHIHADHISALNELNQQTDCLRIMGEKSSSEVIDIRVKDNEKIKIENIELTSIYTPGHTECSYSFLMNDRVFTGDTLLINGSGRTDFQGGNALDQYNSIFNRLLKLPDNTLVYPAHDYNGKKYSKIIDERNNNPRLQVNSPDQYLEIMNNLKLKNPKMMDIAVPANKKGLTLNQL